MITCTLMKWSHAGRFRPEASKAYYKTHGCMDGRPAVREYLGARRIHAACFSLRASSRPALHFCDTVTAAWMQGNLLLLTDKVVWYSTQHSTVRTCAADTAALGRQGKKLLPPSKKKYKSRFSRSQTISNFTKFIQNNINICVTI